MKVKMKSLLVAVSLLFAGTANAQTVQQGLSQLDGDQPSKAKATFESLVAAAPTAENQYYLGYYNLRSGHLDAAKAAFEKGLSIDAKNPLNAVGLASIKVAEKNVGAAKVEFDKIIADTKAKNADVLYRIAEAYVMFYDVNNGEDANKGNNDPGEAIRLIDMIPEKTKVKQLTPEMYTVKGDAFLIKNDGGPAVSAYEQANFIAKSAKIFTKIGVVYLRGKNYQYAVNSYQSAVETDSNYAPIYKRFGEYYNIFNRYKEASKYFRKYVSKAEATPTILLSTAKLLFLAKDYTGSMEFTSQAEAGGAKDNDIYRMKGYSFIELNKCQEGLNNLEQMVKAGVKPYFLDNVYFAKGYQCLNNDSLAAYYYEQAAPIDTNNNHYTTIYGIRYKQKKYDSAADVALKAIEWKTKKKAQITSGDWNNAALAYYFLTAYTPKEDSLKRYDLGMKGDSAFANAIQINSKWPIFHLYRARINNYADYTGTKWAGVPHYESFLAAVDAAKADAASTYKERKEDTYEALRYLAGYHITVSKDLTKAEEYVTKALAIKPEDPDGLKAMLTGTPAAGASATAKPAPKK
jgi:Tfp pilus assembly protein PilF